jgi:hypothetical protein
VDGLTEATYAIEGSLSGFQWPLTPILVAFSSRRLQRDYERLKALLEQEGHLFDHHQVEF